MALRYWVGGTATWDGTAGTKWALTSGGAGGQAVPTSSDDVFFDAASGAVTVTISSAACRDFTCTGFTGTLTGSANINIDRSAVLASAMSFGTGTAIVFTGGTSGTLTSNGRSVPYFTVSKTAGISLTLQDALTVTNAADVTQGTFDTNNFNLTSLGLTSSNSNTRVINLGSSTLTLSGATPVTFTTSTNLTLNAGTSQINLTSASSTFAGGGKTFYNVSFTNTGQSALVLTGANTFNNLSITGRTAVGINPVTFSGDQTINGTLTLGAGTSAACRTFLASNTIGTARTLTCAAVAAPTDIDFRDVTLAGAAAPVSGTRLGDCGGNTSITFVAGKTVYWNLAGAQSWSAVGWATSSGGAPSANNFPLAQDTAVFDNTGSVTGTITVNATWNIGTMNMSARTSAMTLAVTASPAIYGNWTNGTGTTLSGGSIMTFAGRGSQTITSAGKTFTTQFTISPIGGSVTLQDAFICSSTNGNALRIDSGTFDANGFNVTMSSSTTGGINTSATATAKTVAIGSGTWTIAGSSGWNGSAATTITGTGTISLTSGSSKAFIGGSISYSGITLNQGGAGALTITGSNTFGNITNTYSATGATSILFTAGITSTFTNWNASGTAGNLLTISSVTAATHTLSKASGTVSADYLSLTNSIATGGATWYAGANSTNVSGNTGWIFTAPVLNSGNFFMLF